MAMGSDSGGKVFYDALYSPGRLQNDNSNGQSRKLFDDFSVASHVHFLRPQLVSATTKSVLQSQDNVLQSQDNVLKNQDNVLQANEEKLNK